MKKIYYQTVTISLSNGQTDMEELDVELNTRYDKVEGIAAALANGSQENWRVGIQDASGTVLQQIHSSQLLATKDVAMNERFKSVNFPAKGNSMTIQVKPVSALGGDIKVDVIFKLTRKTKNC